MNLNGPNADLQHVRDFPVGVPNRYQAKDVALSGRQPAEIDGDKRFTIS